jgi:hypothetical protein
MNKPISRGLAETRLRKRWKEMTDRFPSMASDTPLASFIARSVHKVMENGQLLAEYDRLPNWH